MPSRKLLVLGATGGTGQQIVAQALEAGHQVTAFVRDPEKLPMRNGRLHVISGSLPRDAALLADALTGQDVVISVLGRGQSFKAEGLIGRSVPAILAAMTASSVRRLIFVSAIGVGDAVYDAPFLSRMLIRCLLKDIYADKAIGEELVRRSRTDWTILQPAQLFDGPLTGRYRSGERLKYRGWPKISRADVAHYILTLVDDATSIGKIVRLSH